MPCQAGQHGALVSPMAEWVRSSPKTALSGKAGLLPPAVIEQDRGLRQPEDFYCPNFVRFQRLSSGRPRSILSANGEVTGSIRATSPSRFRSVASMKVLLPLHLAKTRTSLPLRPFQQLRRTHSDPATIGRLRNDSPNAGSLPDSASIPPSTDVSTALQSLTGMKSTQALFDVGIFHSPPKPPRCAGSLPEHEEIGKAYHQCSLSATSSKKGESPTFAGDCLFGPLPEEVSRLEFADSSSSTEKCCQWNGNGISTHGLLNDPVPAMDEDILRPSHALKGIETESKWLKGALEDTSWLDDPSDNERSSDSFSSNVSLEESTGDVESSTSLKTASSAESLVGSVIVSR